jgi:undecaprenyl-diphosphatase
MDTTLVTWLNDAAQHPGARQAAEWGAKFLVAAPVLVVAYLAVRSLWRRDARALASMVAAGIGTALALAANVVATSLWYRPRPYTALSQLHPLIPPNPESSFFSDHTVIVAGCAMAALLVSRRWGAVAAGAAVLVGVARVAVGAHYPSDVLVAALVTVGAIAALLPLRHRLMPLIDRGMGLLPDRPVDRAEPSRAATGQPGIT